MGRLHGFLHQLRRHYAIHSVARGVDEFLPVDVNAPGCPPRPEAFLEGVSRLREAVGRQRRPLPPLLRLVTAETAGLG